jgi:hypothetical protein
MRFSIGPIRNAGIAGAVFLVAVLALPKNAKAELKRNHITIGVGYQGYFSDDLKGGGLDFSNSELGTLAYRLTLSPKFDLTFDAIGTTSTETDAGSDITVNVGFFGPGVRYIAPHEGVRPYVQANIFIVGEDFSVQSGNTTYNSNTESSAGFGASAGVDIRASNLLSIPVQAQYLYGKPADNLSSLGFLVGLTFNFGTFTQP